MPLLSKCHTSTTVHFPSARHTAFCCANKTYSYLRTYIELRYLRYRYHNKFPTFGIVHSAHHPGQAARCVRLGGPRQSDCHVSPVLHQSCLCLTNSRKTCVGYIQPGQRLPVPKLAMRGGVECRRVPTRRSDSTL